MHLFFRWGNTPLDDAMQFGLSAVVKELQEYQSIYTHTLMPEELSTDAGPDSTMDVDELKSMETLESLVWARTTKNIPNFSLSLLQGSMWVWDLWQSLCKDILSRCYWDSASNPNSSFCWSFKMVITVVSDLHSVYCGTLKLPGSSRSFLIKLLKYSLVCAWTNLERLPFPSHLTLQKKIYFIKTFLTGRLASN